MRAVAERLDRSPDPEVPELVIAVEVDGVHAHGQRQTIGWMFTPRVAQAVAFELLRVADPTGEDVPVAAELEGEVAVGEAAPLPQPPAWRDANWVAMRVRLDRQLDRLFDGRERARAAFVETMCSRYQVSSLDELPLDALVTAANALVAGAKRRAQGRSSR